jgi:cytoskeletal protein CcmA (bactofilin family)
VRVPHILINGSIVGDVYATQRVELAAKARITGNVYYTLLEMAMGCEVNGQLLRTKADSPRMTGFRHAVDDDIEEV